MGIVRCSTMVEQEQGQGSTRQSNGKLPGQRNLTWKPEYDIILADIARTNTVSTEWSELKGLFMYKIAENVDSLPLVPPPPPTPARNEDADATAKDVDMAPTEDDAAQKAALEGEGQLLQQQVWDSLDGFSSEPPFTIQRLAELTISPSRHYSTAVKYLRAIHRTLQVSSGMSSFVRDTYALSPGPGESSLLGHASTAASDATSPLLQSSPSPVASPLLSPIPWIAAASASGDSDSEDGHLDPASSPHMAPVNGHDASLAEGGSPSLPPASPTGGRVDELDPLPPSLSASQPAGMTEAPLPISDPQGSPPRNSHSPDGAGSPPNSSRTRRPSL